MNSESMEIVDRTLPAVQRAAAESAPKFLSAHTGMREILSRINLIANSSASVLITGESGTGKDVIARMIHHASERRQEPFIAINCAALPKDVVDNELFGHEKEAFTGAISKKSGCFELANAGTLFLDEVVEMHPQTQAKLLRAIENKSFRRLGGREEVHVDTRVVAATNRDIVSALKEGILREDLFYRLSVVEIDIPALRERKGDVPLLLHHFLALFAGQYGQPMKRFSDAAIQSLTAYDWPGNVRELRNLVERMTLVCADECIDVKQLPDKIASGCSNLNSVTVPVGISLAESEKLLIDRTLLHVDNNKSAAARILGISRRTLHSKLKGKG